MDPPASKRLRLPGKDLACKWPELKEPPANLHVMQPFRTRVAQLIKDLLVKSLEPLSWQLTSKMVQPTLFMLKVLARDQT